MKMSSILGAWLLMAVPILGQNAKSATMKGLPGVELTGDLTRPVIRNHTPRKIVGYTINFDYLNGGVAHVRTAFGPLRNGDRSTVLPPGGSQLVIPSWNIVGPDGPLHDLTGVALDAVIFDDGEVVGPDSNHTADAVQAQLQAEKDLDQQFLELKKSRGNADAWNYVYDVQDGRFRIPDHVLNKAIYAAEIKSRATELIRVLRKQDENAALDLAARSALYPTLWRKK